MEAEVRHRARAAAGRYLLALLILAALFLAVPFAKTWQSLASADVVCLLGGALLFTGSRWIGAARTRRLVRQHGVELTTPRLFEISCASTLYGLALPGTLSGGLVRWHRLGQLQQSHGAAAGVVAFERLVDYAALVTLGLAAWLADARAPHTPVLTAALALTTAALVLAVAVSLSPLPTRLARRLSPSPEHVGPAARLRDAASRALIALPRHGAGRTLALTLAASLALHGVATGAVAVLAAGLSLGLGYTSVLWLRAITVVITAFPLTPAGLGVREIGSVFLLGLLGLSAADAVALSLLQFAAVLLFAALGGLFEVRRFLLHPAPPARHGLEDSEGSR